MRLLTSVNLKIDIVFSLTNLHNFIIIIFNNIKNSAKLSSIHGISFKIQIFIMHRIFSNFF